MTPTPVVLVCAFCYLYFLLPLPQDVWIGHQLALTKNKISYSPFSSLPSSTVLKVKTQTSSRQPTTGGCYLLVTLLIFMFFFSYPITTKAMLEGASKQKQNLFLFA